MVNLKYKLTEIGIYGKNRIERILSLGSSVIRGKLGVLLALVLISKKRAAKFVAASLKTYLAPLMFPAKRFQLPAEITATVF